MICFALDFGLAYVFKSLAYSSTCLYHTVHWSSSTTCSSSISVTNQLISSSCESKTMPATFQPLTSGCSWCSHLATHTHTFNGPFSRTTRVGWYQKGKTNLDFTEARDSEWQWHQLGHMQVCILLQTDSHASISPLSVLQAGCPSCLPTNSIKALKAAAT